MPAKSLTTWTRRQVRFVNDYADSRLHGRVPVVNECPDMVEIFLKLLKMKKQMIIW